MVFDDQNTVQRKRAVIIGRNLRALRQKADKTLADVAQQVGISVSHLANAEHGRRTLGGENLRRVLQLYEFSLGVFLSHIERLLISDQREESTYNGAIEPLQKRKR
jgi:transcriptional regulator with XRE-family HTH domain